MRISSKLSWAAGAAVVLTLAPFSAGLASAMSGSDDGSSSGSTTSSTSETSNKERESKLEAQREAIREAAEKATEQRDKLKTAIDNHKGKLTDVKLKLCQKRQAFVGKKMDQLATRETKQLEFLDTISSRLQKYVSTRQLTVADYDTLVAAINAKQAAAKANVTALQAQKSNFKCDGDNPKGAATTYLTALRNTNTSLKEYRDSIKKLLLAVKAVHPTADKAKASDDNKEQQ